MATDKNAAAEEQPKDLSEAIVRISDSMRTLLKSGLNRRAIIALLHDSTKVSKRDIDTVLSGLDQLKHLYTK